MASAPVNLTPDQAAFMTDVHEVLEQIGAMLQEKNICYGNSALEPVGIFSKLPATSTIEVRIDDKLSRLLRGKEYPGDDTVRDLLGYLVLYMVAKKRAGASVPGKQGSAE